MVQRHPIPNHYKALLGSDVATFFFDYLRQATPWHDGIRDRYRKVTRQAYAVPVIPQTEIDATILGLVAEVAKRITTAPHAIHGIYVNHYRDGNDRFPREIGERSDRTPTHSHPGTIQLVISLGATRTLKIGSRAFTMDHGDWFGLPNRPERSDVIVFGGSPHGVPIEPTVTGARISIAAFMTPVNGVSVQ